MLSAGADRRWHMFDPVIDGAIVYGRYGFSYAGDAFPATADVLTPKSIGHAAVFGGFDA